MPHGHVRNATPAQLETSSLSEHLQELSLGTTITLAEGVDDVDLPQDTPGL